ncbi:LacI family DNA-binding transcriptional regulator [Lunatibacter salilacus]|uniref:LacI family DNA-binding transcriptional regulator n=1 Tax=Lunatibacter salilacus TaxID=2483804 RepID=UPI00131E45ED|nr:LacI family DNA-binding transcriptional regulator [Lunatibacter salilacus]
MKKPITIKDIAEKLNVSVATVSRAMRNSSEIRKETKKAVLQMAKEMDYHPNLLASSLSSKRSNIIGIVVPTINRYFWSNSIAGIENIAYEKGYKVMIFQSGESFVKEEAIVETLANSRVDGIIIAFSKETQTFDHIQHILDRDIPVVLFERTCESIQTSMIKTDDASGAREMANHLISRGKKNIAYIGGPMSLGVCRKRYEGFRIALEQADIHIHQDLVVALEDFTFELAGEALVSLWKQDPKPDAIFCFADILAIGVLHKAQKMGIKVPEELAIAGFGNDITGKFITPSISTMSQPSFEMGQMAARIILDAVESDEEIVKVEERLIVPTLIVREST